MRPERFVHVRVGINGAVLLGMTLAAGMLAGARAQHSSQHSGSTTPVTNEPITPPSTSQPGMLPAVDSPGGGIADPGIRAHMEAERLKAANDDRHKRLITDVDKLISLTNELKGDVDKANKDELSLDVVRKAQEIEKLAHDVQSRMKN